MNETASELNKNFEVYDTIQAESFDNLIIDNKTDRNISIKQSDAPKKKKVKKKKQTL